MTYREHTIVIPPMKQGQGELRHTISVPIRIEDGMDFLTPEAMEIIDRIQAQMLITRLVNTVKEMNGLPVDLSGTLGIDRTQNGSNVDAPAEVPEPSPDELSKMINDAERALNCLAIAVEYHVYQDVYAKIAPIIHLLKTRHPTGPESLEAR